MVAAPSNFAVANHTIDHLLRGVPYTFGLHTFMEQTVHSMLEDRVREAMMYVFLHSLDSYALIPVNVWQASKTPRGPAYIGKINIGHIQFLSRILESPAHQTL